MSPPVSRGFHRRRPAGEPGKLPPGQYLVQGFPVLSAGPTPHTPLPDWTFSIRHSGDTLKSWTWPEFQALPAETVTVDIHCVTRWSKLGTVWRGVPVDTLLAQVDHDSGYVLAFSDGGYTANLPVADVTSGQAWVAFSYDGQPLEPEHGGPARLLVPTCTSGKARNGCGGWNCSITTNPASGKATATTSMETHGANSGTRATDLAGRQRELGDHGNGLGPHDRA